MIDASLDYGAGWFRVREALVDELVGDPRYHATLLVYVALERRARRHHAGPRTSRAGVVDLRVGQAVCGERELAKYLGLDRQRVRTALRNLVQRGVITLVRDDRGTVVTFAGYPGSLDETTLARNPESNPAAKTPIASTGHENQPAPPTTPTRSPTHHQPTPNPPLTPNEREIRKGARVEDQVLGQVLPVPEPGQHLGADLVRPGAGAVVEVERLSREDARRQLFGSAWSFAAAELRELEIEGLKGARPGAWGGLPSASSDEAKALFARIDELTVSGDWVGAEHVIRNRVRVAAARARMDKSTAFFVPAWMWDAEHFAKWKDMDPTAVAQLQRGQQSRQGPRRSQAIGSATPRNDHGEGLYDCKDLFQ